VARPLARLFVDGRRGHGASGRPAPAARGRRQLLRGAPWNYIVMDTEASQTLVHKDDTARWTSSSAWASSRPSWRRPLTQPELAKGGGEAKGWVCAAAEEKSRFLRDLEACQKEYHASGPLPPPAAAAAAPAAALTAPAAAPAAAPDPTAAPAAASAPAALAAPAFTALEPKLDAAEPDDDAEIASATANFQLPVPRSL
jgi:hypothetical protein